MSMTPGNLLPPFEHHTHAWWASVVTDAEAMEKACKQVDEHGDSLALERILDARQECNKR